MARYKKKERQELLVESVSSDPFLTDERLSEMFAVSIQTIRLDRLELNIPELRERIKHVAREETEKIRSLSLQEVIGEIIDIELNSHALSLFIVEEGHVFQKNRIARGHYLFAQANSLCVAVIDEPLALTKAADIEFVRPAKLGDKVVSKASVEQMDGNTAVISMESTVEQRLVFKGVFEMYYRDEDNEGEKNG
ncbi:transcription factor FapR [Salinicoccus albus]|uniref:transcription factor FapR n=1 Tax=Salinicoccus albus TaxID=418756 RepID=UPI00036C45B2|nr:transcription factor FapR [Salinicoccus albus]